MSHSKDRMLHMINPPKELSRIGRLVFVGSFFLIFEAFLILKIPIANFVNIFSLNDFTLVNLIFAGKFNEVFRVAVKNSTLYVYFWTFLALVFFGVMSYLIKIGSSLAIRVHRGFAGFWIGVSVALTLAQQNVALGFFTLSLGFYSYILSRYIYIAFQRSYINPNCPWYQRVPNPIGPLNVSMIDRNGVKKNLLASRIDEDGCFIFSNQEDLKKCFGEKFGKKIEQIELHFRNYSIQTDILPIRWLIRDSIAVGIGVQFKASNYDDLKDLTDFVYRLKGEGYGEDHSTFF